jgi:hypothetical protein
LDRLRVKIGTTPVLVLCEELSNLQLFLLTNILGKRSKCFTNTKEKSVYLTKLSDTDEYYKYLEENQFLDQEQKESMQDLSPEILLISRDILTNFSPLFDKYSEAPPFESFIKNISKNNGGSKIVVTNLPNDYLSANCCILESRKI